MEIVLNDYSLSGQFETIEDFAMCIHEEYLKMFDYIVKNRIELYKKSDFYSRYITKNETISDLFRITGDPIVTKMRSFIINAAYNKPYWDDEEVSKTNLTCTYNCIHDEELPNCFSEAIERDKIIISLKNEEFLDESYLFYKDGKEEIVNNIVDYNNFLHSLLNSKNSDVKYIFENYRFQREIKFVQINGRCYAEEAILNNNLTSEDKWNVLIHIPELIRGLSTGTKNRFWDSLSDGLFEYRISVSSGREFRMLFFQEQAIYFINGFIKKVQETPKHEIDKAKKIKRDFYQG